MASPFPVHKNEGGESVLVTVTIVFPLWCSITQQVFFTVQNFCGTTIVCYQNFHGLNFCGLNFHGEQVFEIHTHQARSKLASLPEILVTEAFVKLCSVAMDALGGMDYSLASRSRLPHMKMNSSRLN